MNGDSFEYWTQHHVLTRLCVVNDCYLVFAPSNSLILNKHNWIVDECYAVLVLPLVTLSIGPEVYK